MTKNTLGDLSLHLFAQLERLNDESLSGDRLKEEIERAKAVSDVAAQAIANANTMIKVIKVRSDRGLSNAGVPRALAGGEE